MNEPAVPVYCACGERCERVFTAPYFQEDRLRFWRNAEGGRFDASLGEEKPETRQEFNRILKERGQEAISWRDIPEHFKRASEISAYNRDQMARGEEPIDAEKVAAYVAEPREPDPSVESQLDAIGYRRGLGTVERSHPEDPDVNAALSKVLEVG